jgi:hypothetical protein
LPPVVEVGEGALALQAMAFTLVADAWPCGLVEWLQ